MTEIIRVRKLNDVHLKVDCDSGVAQEIGEHFTFNVPGAKFSPAYKNKMWDGKIRLFHLMRGTLYVGLLPHLQAFAASRDYEFEIENANDFGEEIFSEQEAKEHIAGIGLPEGLNVRDYQLAAFMHGVRKKRALLISPTASGKSLIIYLLSTFFVRHKILIVVPTINLVHQMASDFVSYGCPADLIHKIHGGQEKQTDAYITITTWQSVYQQPKQWFNQYGVIIGDEAHQFKAKSLVDIMEKLTDCQYKFGFTGTLDGTQTNELVLEGLFGSKKQVTTTAELMSSNSVAQLNIKSIVLSYSDQVRQTFAKTKPEYKQELQYLVKSKHRNKFIVNLVSSLKNNTLLLFNFVEHGNLLYNALVDANPDRKVFIVHGLVEGEEREAVRKYAENHTDVIIVASYKTFSTGVNIPSLRNVVFGSPSKSRVRVLQSIGRGLRLDNQKSSAVLYDIADDISWKSYKNHSSRHFAERIQMYNQEKFDYKIYTIKLEGSQ